MISGNHVISLNFHLLYTRIACDARRISGHMNLGKKFIQSSVVLRDLTTETHVAKFYCLTELFCNINIAPQRKSFLAWSILPDVDTVNAEAYLCLSSCALEYAWLIYMWFLPVLYIYLQFINFNQEKKSFMC